MKSALKTSEIDMEAQSGDVVRLRPARADDITIAWDGATQSEWDEVCGTAATAPVYQSFAYGEALVQMGRHIIRARLFSGDALIGVALIETRKLLGVFTLAHIMRGPVWARSDTTDEIKIATVEAIRKNLPVRGAHALVILPDGANETFLKPAGYKCVMSGYHTALLDISGDEAALYDRLNGKWRNRLRAAQKTDLRILPISKKPEKYAWLLEKEGARQQTLGYRTHANTIAPLYQSVVGKRSLFAFEAKQGTERVGGVLFLKHGHNATYHIGWTSDEGKMLNANNLLLWHAIKVLKKEGVRILDLDGLNTDFNPGIARFKIGTGARVISMSGAWTKGPRWK